MGERLRLEAQRKAEEERLRLEAQRKVEEERLRLVAERKAEEERLRLVEQRKAEELAARLEAQRKAEDAEQKQAAEAIEMEYTPKTFKSNLTVYTIANEKATTDVYRGWKDYAVELSYDKNQRRGTFKQDKGMFKTVEMFRVHVGTLKSTPTGITLNCAVRLRSNVGGLLLKWSQSEWTNVQLVLSPPNGAHTEHWKGAIWEVLASKQAQDEVTDEGSSTLSS